MPSTIERVQRDSRERGLTVLAINIQEGSRMIRAWIDARRLAVPVLLDPAGAVTATSRVTATPTTFPVGRDGRLAARAVGTREWTGRAGRALLEALLAP